MPNGPSLVAGAAALSPLRVSGSRARSPLLLMLRSGDIMVEQAEEKVYQTILTMVATAVQQPLTTGTTSLVM